MSQTNPGGAFIGKNFLGLGPNVTGLALGTLFFGVYYGSVLWTRKWVIEQVEEPKKPMYFRDVTVTDNSANRERD